MDIKTPYLLFILLSLSGCMTQPVRVIPVAQMTDDVYPSEVNAVTGAMETFLQRSTRENREYIGGIYETGSGYAFSVAPGRKGKYEAQARMASASLVALWHTHANVDKSSGSQILRNMFSTTDVELVEETGLPLYLITQNGTIKIYRPGDPKTAHLDDSPIILSRPYARGTVID